MQIPVLWSAVDHQLRTPHRGEEQVLNRKQGQASLYGVGVDNLRLASRVSTRNNQQLLGGAGWRGEDKKRAKEATPQPSDASKRGQESALPYGQAFGITLEPVAASIAKAFEEFVLDPKSAEIAAVPLFDHFDNQPVAAVAWGGA